MNRSEVDMYVNMNVNVNVNVNVCLSVRSWWGGGLSFFPLVVLRLLCPLSWVNSNASFIYSHTCETMAP